MCLLSCCCGWIRRRIQSESGLGVGVGGWRLGWLDTHHAMTLGLGLFSALNCLWLIERVAKRACGLKFMA
eukprot:374019-Amorphochlora_amoeboformis.AAC.1